MVAPGGLMAGVRRCLPCDNKRDLERYHAQKICPKGGGPRRGHKYPSGQRKWVCYSCEAERDRERRRDREPSRAPTTGDWSSIELQPRQSWRDTERYNDALAKRLNSLTDEERRVYDACKHLRPRL